LLRDTGVETVFSVPVAATSVRLASAIFGAGLKREELVEDEE